MRCSPWQGGRCNWIRLSRCLGFPMAYGLGECRCAEQKKDAVRDAGATKTKNGENNSFSCGGEDEDRVHGMLPAIRRGSSAGHLASMSGMRGVERMPTSQLSRNKFRLPLQRR